MSFTVRPARWLGALAVLVLAAACSAGGPAATPEADAAPATSATADPSATTTMAPATTSAPATTVAPTTTVPPTTTTTLALLAADPGEDVWIPLAETRKLLRFDTKTKDFVAELDLAETGCIGWRSMGHQFDQKVDPITLVGFVPGSNPEMCVARLAIDGGDGELRLQKAPLDFAVEDFQVTRLDKTLWMSMFNRSTNQSALYSFDLRRGTFEQVMDSVVDVASAGGKIHLVHGTTEEFWGPREAGILDDSNTLQPLDLGTEDFISGVKVYEENLIYHLENAEGATGYRVVDPDTLGVTAIDLGVEDRALSPYSDSGPVVAENQLWTGGFNLMRYELAGGPGELIQSCRVDDSATCGVYPIAEIEGSLWGMEITPNRWYMQQYDLESGEMVAEVKIPGA